MLAGITGFAGLTDFTEAALATIAHSSTASAGETDRVFFYDASLAESRIPRPDLPVIPGAVVSREATRGAPALLVSAPTKPAPAGSSPLEAARHHLQKLRDAYGISQAVIDGARPLFTHDTGRGGLIVVLRQTIAGVDIFHGDVKVLLDRELRLVAVSGSPHPEARPDRAQSFGLSPTAAISSAINDLYGPILSAEQLAPASRKVADESTGARFFELASDAGPHTLNMRVPALAKPVYFPLAGGLVPAFFVETQVYTNSDLDGTAHVIAADDGRVLYRRSLKAHDAYDYRVWADAEGDHRPADGPLIDFTPHPTGTPGDGPIDETKPNLISIEGFNTNPDGIGDPWLPPGSTESLGNNVDAYVDHLGPSGFNPEDGEFRAATSSPSTFDYSYDLTSEPLASPEQSMAATIQLFYDVNWLHDYWYDSGFNEAAGNAQDDNYGRGGAGGDRLQAQAQDGALTGSRNNANMTTPGDGVSPIMQMYLWSPRNNTATLMLSPGDQEYVVSKGQFSPTTYDLSGPMVLIDDGQGMSSTDGCEPPQNDVAGKIVVIDRGDCTFETKANGAEMMGAIAVVILDNVDGNQPPGLGNDTEMDDPTIPVQAVTKTDGAMIKEALTQGDVIATLTGEAGAERDGTIDNQIVAHEWGHYFHHRLVDCGSAQCSAMSEGWGDFIALHQALREGEDIDGTFASQTYAGFDPTGYFGIRRVPYSANMEKNPLTFGHISATATLPVIDAINIGGANNEVHNAGEVWATMMWEVYTSLHRAHADDMSFDEVRRLLSDYVVAGMILTPPVPTITEQRDAILLAISQFDEDDFTTVAEAFARRGAGTCAISPARDSVDFIGVVESFELRANATISNFAVNENESCDDDGVIDGGETGTIAIQIYNNGVQDLGVGATLEVISASTALLFPDGSSQSLPAIPRLQKINAFFKIAVGEGQGDVEHINLTVRLTTPGGCEEHREIKLPLVIHGDINPESSTLDDVEVPDSPWLIEGMAGDIAWQREAADSGDYVWHGRDLGSISDTSLISPPLEVADGEPLVIAFEHAFKFEYAGNIAWDGGVLEISDDQGESWTDVAAYVDPGYNGTINAAPNPINSRLAFVDESPNYPKLQAMSLDFGDAFAGKTVLFRFRIGTDTAMGAPGWSIDNIDIGGITNTPFPTWTADNCGMGPTTAGETETETGTGTDSDGSATSGGEDGIDDGGCGCSAGASEPAGKAASLALWLGLAGLLRRRRRRT